MKSLSVLFIRRLSHHVVCMDRTHFTPTALKNETDLKGVERDNQGPQEGRLKKSRARESDAFWQRGIEKAARVLNRYQWYAPKGVL